MAESSGIQTDEKKQHFDDIYVAPNPVPFKERIIDALDYISDGFNRQTFDRLILPWAEKTASESQPLRYVDLCCCFGNTSMAVINGMTVDEIKANWADDRVCENIQKPRRLPIHTTGIDISANAVAYGKRAGIFDEVIETNLNEASPEVQGRVDAALSTADIMLSTASLVYLEIPAIAHLVRTFAEAPKEGYLLVNFLNPFALEKGDETKRILLRELDFVGSTATRHRRLSPFEQENYAGEEWSLLEIWVLKRRV